MRSGESPLPPIRLVHAFARIGLPLPDALIAVLLAAAAAMDFLSPEQLAALPPALHSVGPSMMVLLLVEGGFLMMQGTLIDIATRLKKRPPVWAVPLIAGAVLLLSNEAREVLRMAWQQGALVAVPLVISLAERAMVLWHLPNAARTRKLAERALIGNRIATGLVLFGLVTAAMVAGTMVPRFYDPYSQMWAPLLAGAIYYGVAAFDEWRVRGRRFAEKPGTLFGWDVIGVTYLEPL